MQHIEHNGITLAFILRVAFNEPGIHFLTPDSFSQQLGYMQRPQGYSILPHDHNLVARTVELTQEVLFIKRGKVRLDLYAPETREYLESHILHAGDVVLLAHGGHGFLMLEQSEIIEVKQGPYAGGADKSRFPAVEEQSVIIKGHP